MDVASDLASLQLDPDRGRPQPPAGSAGAASAGTTWPTWRRCLARPAAVRVLGAPAAAIVCTEDYPIHSLLMRRYPRPQRPQPHGPGWPPTRPCAARSCVSCGQRSPPDQRDRGPGRDRLAVERLTAGRNVDRMLDALWTQGPHHGRRPPGQQRVWDLAERCLPAWAPTRRPPEREVVRLAAQRSLRALGVATTRDIDRHFTAGRYPGLAATLAGLERAGRVEQVHLSSNGAEHPGPGTSTPTTCPCWSASGRATGSRGRPRLPFDNLLIDRERTERLFGFHFRMEIYVPKAARRYGYYVLLVLHGDRLIGRVDPAIDRARNRLVVQAIHAEFDALGVGGPSRRRRREGPGHLPGGRRRRASPAIPEGLAGRVRLSPTSTRAGGRRPRRPAAGGGRGGAGGGHVGEPGLLGLGDQVLALLPGEGMVLEPATRPGEALGDQQAAARVEDRRRSARPAAGSVQWWKEATAQATVASPPSSGSSPGGAVGYADGVPQRRRRPPGRQPAHLRRRVDPDRRRPPAPPPPAGTRPGPHPTSTTPSPGPTLRQLGDEPLPAPARTPSSAHRAAPGTPLNSFPVAVAVAYMPLLMVCALLLVIRCLRCHALLLPTAAGRAPGSIPSTARVGSPTHRPH